MKALGEICEVISGGTPLRSRTEFWENGDIPWIKIGNMNGKYINKSDEYITKLGLKNSATKILPIGTILYSIFATLGETGILSIEACTNQAIAGIIIKDRTQVCTEYLYYFLKSKKKNVRDIGRGVAQNNINISILKEFKVFLPERVIQCKIADIFDKIENIIDMRKVELDLLDKLVRARFVEMFGIPDLNSMGWEESFLSEKLDVLGGYAFKSDEFDVDMGIPVLRIGNINSGYFRTVNMVYWREDPKLERYAMYPGDLVMSLTGTVGKDDYGNVCILGNDFDKYYLNQRNAKLEIKEGLDKLYLSEILKFEAIKKRLTGISRGVRQANISNRDILNLCIPVPPMHKQKQFATFVEQVNKSKFDYLLIISNPYIQNPNFAVK